MEDRKSAIQTRWLLKALSNNL